ncbi:MAG: type II secretion system F family protein [Lentisphaeria bacterium]
MVFKYVASVNDGGKERGVITAENLESAEAILKERQKTIIRIEAVRSSVTDSPYFNLTERSHYEKLLSAILISSLQKELVLGQLSAMLEGGIPILNAFQTVAAQSGYFMSRALFCVVNKLQSGKLLTETLSEEMPFLGNIVIGLLGAGEANGDIDQMCRYSANLLERQRKLKGQVMQAMAYPIMVILATIGIVTFLMLNVIPKIMKFLAGRSAKLPPITQALVDVTGFLQKYGIYVLLAPIVITIVIILLRRTPETAYHVDFFALRLPVIGKVFQASSNMLWSRTLGILTRSGIHIIPALDFTMAALNNYFYRSELDKIKDLLSQGHPLSTAFRVSELRPFVPLADAMLVVGENTGRMDAGLLKVADFCDIDLQRRIALLSKMIEPALFVIVGSIVGFVYIAFFMGLMAASTAK